MKTILLEDLQRESDRLYKRYLSLKEGARVTVSARKCNMYILLSSQVSLKMSEINNKIFSLNGLI